MRRLVVHLASRSPRRLELLAAAGLAPRRVVARADERPRSGEPVERLVRRLAEAKGRDGLRRLPPDAPPGVLLAADTEVVLDGRALGKPAGADEALEMLRALRGRSHEVITGVFLARTGGDGRWTCDAATTRVVFRRYDDEHVAGYVASGEPLDKAGAYGIQGRGALLAERIEGSWSNVVGLPLERLPGWLGRLGVAWRELA